MNSTVGCYISMFKCGQQLQPSIVHNEEIRIYCIPIQAIKLTGQCMYEAARAKPFD
jgi:hypothetical protein